MTSILEESKKSKGIGKFEITKKKIIISIIALLVLSSAYYFFNKKDTEKESVSQKEWTVIKDSLKISIESDGKVIAEDGVELSFSVSGNNLEVKEVFIKEGDKIRKGDKIATVKTETLELNVRTAYSNYLSVLADYNQTMNGATEEQIADAKDTITSAEIYLNQAEISLENTKQTAEENIQNAKNDIYDAENDLENAKEDLDDNQDELTSETVNDAYENLVDTIKSINISLNNILKESDRIIGVDDKSINNDFRGVLSVLNISSLNQAKNSYLKSKNELAELDSLVVLLNFSSSYDEINTASDQTVLALQEFEKHLYFMDLTLEATITSSNFSQSELNSFISTISANRTTVNTKITLINTKAEAVDDAKNSLDDYITDHEDAERDLDNAKQDLINADADALRNIENSEATIKSRELSLEQAKRDYDNLIAPLTEAEKSYARSKLTSASVNLEKAQNELENATILSPIDGEVARLNYKTGDIIIDNGNTDPVAVIINNDTLFIEVDIEESDINKIKIGQTVYADFDALDNIKLDGAVSFISLTSKTNSNGIVTYLVRIVIIDKGNNQIREGMTAFVDFVTAEAKDVLVVPVNAVQNVNNKPSVLNKDGEWVSVTTGFTDGKNVEIIKGLEIGDKIIY
ncbi:MAG: efflux RND transporter periplasmic adaptor subunit [Candidatus Pacebacteria bacterium]|nr:efflux RND transporter periplasmic adaptor subunit [Candidatus Paceibacterota bacterium]